MLTLFRKIFTWWNRDTFGTRLKTIFLESMLEKIISETNIMRVKKEKDGLFILAMLTHQISLLNGFHGYISPKIKLSKSMNLKNIVGRSLINQI